MLNLIWNTISNNMVLLIPAVLCAIFLPFSLLCFLDVKVQPEGSSSNILPILGVGTGLYTIHKLHQVQKELKELKEQIKYSR